MTWEEIRSLYPDQWLIIEAMLAHTERDGLRRIEKIGVIERCVNGEDALARYRQLHRQHPQREFYYVHTSRSVLDIHETQWVGVRRNHAADAEG